MGRVRTTSWWENPDGYTTKDVPNSELVEVTLDPVAPLTLICPEYGAVQPDRHQFQSDYGSIPLWVAGLPLIGKWFTKTRFKRAYLLHDSIYQHKGWYTAAGYFRECEQVDADKILEAGIVADGGPAWVARAERWVLSKLGCFAWQKYRREGKRRV